MKRISLFFFLLTYHFSIQMAQAQAGRRSSLNTDTIKGDFIVSSFFENHESLDSIQVSYQNNIPKRLLLYNNWNLKGSYLPFDLLYEADSIYFSAKYNVIEKNIKSLIFNNYSTEELNKQDIISIKITRDRVIFYLRPKPNIYTSSDFILGWPAYFSKDISVLEVCIQHKLMQDKLLNISDSILVYDLLILRNDKLAKIELIVGDNSNFSMQVVNCLISNGSLWKAAVLETSGLRKDTNIRVLVKLNPNNTITIKTPKRLNSIFGY